MSPSTLALDLPTHLRAPHVYSRSHDNHLAAMENADIHVHKRSTRTDPLIVLVGVVVAFTLLPSLLNVATAACKALGLQTELPLLVLRLAALGVLAACSVPPVRQLLKTFAAVSRRSKALRDLPGPSYGILGILPLLWRKKDIHRQLTKWADEFGPIYRVRVAVFHVGPQWLLLNMVASHGLMCRAHLKGNPEVMQAIKLLQMLPYACRQSWSPTLLWRVQSCAARMLTSFASCTTSWMRYKTSLRVVPDIQQSHGHVPCLRTSINGWAASLDIMVGDVQFLLGINVLTGPSDAHWRVVRKGVSPAFSTNRMRGACTVITQVRHSNGRHLSLHATSLRAHAHPLTWQIGALVF